MGVAWVAGAAAAVRVTGAATAVVVGAAPTCAVLTTAVAGMARAALLAATSGVVTKGTAAGLDASALLLVDG